MMPFGYFYPPASWRDIAKHTIHEISDDHCFGLAAQLAFYFLLALFPALLFVVALIGYLPVENALARSRRRSSWTCFSSSCNRSRVGMKPAC